MSDTGNDGNPGRGQLSPEERADLKRRAAGIGERLEEVRVRRMPPEESRRRGQALGLGMRIAVELVAGVAVGGFIGWWLDSWLGTKPWLFIVLLMLGFVAGMANVIRTAQRMQTEAEPLQRSAPSVKDDDDER